MTTQLAARSVGQPDGNISTPMVKCRLCQCKLGNESTDDFEAALCGSCVRRPEARRLGAGGPAAAFSAARNFTEAEKSLIRKIHGYMLPVQLLALLNERLVSDLGPDAVRYSMDQLQSEIGHVLESAGGGTRDWPSLRLLLSQARRDRILNEMTAELINAFAVVYALTAKQEMSLLDILLGEEKP